MNFRALSNSTWSRTTLKSDNANSLVGFDAPLVNHSKSSHALIVGAGLAGCAIAGVLAAKGIRCSLFDSNTGIAQNTSSVPVAVFKPYHSSTTSIEKRFIDQCYTSLLENLRLREQEFLSVGLHQVVAEHSNFQQSSFWQEIDEANIPLPENTVFCREAGAIKPAKLCANWIKHPNIECHFKKSIRKITRDKDNWEIMDDQNETAGSGDLLILTNSMAAQNFIPELPLIPVAGQISLFESDHSGSVVCDNGYVVPTSSGIWSGATFHRNISQIKTTEADDLKNLERVKRLIGNCNPTALNAWSGVRCTTPDRMPLVGPVPEFDYYLKHYSDLSHGKKRKRYPSAKYQEGLYVFAGLGSRGLVQSLYCAECLADTILGFNHIDNIIKRAIHPARFTLRQLRRNTAKN